MVSVLQRMAVIFALGYPCAPALAEQPPIAIDAANAWSTTSANPEFRKLNGSQRLGEQLAQAFAIIKPAFAAETVEWMRLRGVNARRAAGADDAFFQQMKNDNIKLLRTGTSPENLVDENGEINMAMVAKIDQTLEKARQYDIRVVIDPHTFPGFADKHTTRPEDIFWTDYKYHDIFVKTWEFLAERYKDAGDVLAGYDLLNEPNPPSFAPTDGPGNWPRLAERAIAAIRKHDTTHPIIVHANGGRAGGFRINIEGVQFLKPPYFNPGDRNLVYQIHMYQPTTYASQAKGTYPGEQKGAYWDKEKLRQTLQPARDFQLQTGAEIYVGEFAPNTKAENGVTYMRDLIDIFEEYGWSWTFHTYLGGGQFDITRNPEMYAAIRKYWALNPTNVVSGS